MFLGNYVIQMMWFGEVCNVPKLCCLQCWMPKYKLILFLSAFSSNFGVNLQYDRKHTVHRQAAGQYQ